MSINSILNTKSVTAVQLKDWNEKWREEDGEQDELRIKVRDRLSFGTVLCIQDELPLLQTNSSKLASMLNQLTKACTQKSFGQVHTLPLFFVLFMRFNQMIDVADTMTTCAELEDNVTPMGDLKVFLKLQEAMNAMRTEIV
jgi:hypothetical protein